VNNKVHHSPLSSAFSLVVENFIVQIMNNTTETCTGAGVSAGAATLRRGLHMLAALRRAPAGLTVAAIAEALAMHRTSVYRYICVLVEEGYVSHDPHSGRYCATQTDGEMDERAAAVARLTPIMRTISSETGDSSFLICRAGADALCLHREIGSYPIQVLTVTVGHRQPLGVGSAGLALLAALPVAEAEHLIQQNSAALRAYGDMTAARMHLLCEATRNRGWSVVGNSAVPGALGIGAALRDRHGYPRLALSVCSTLDRMPVARQRQIAALLRHSLADVVS